MKVTIMMLSSRYGRLAFSCLLLLRCRIVLPMAILGLLPLVFLPLLLWPRPSIAAIAKLPGMPLGLAVDDATHRVVLTTVANDAVLTWDGPSATPLGDAVFPDGYGTAVAVDAVSGRVYVASTLSQLVVLGSPIPTPVATIDLDQIPIALAINPATARVYVAMHNPRRDAGPDDLVMLDGARETILAEVPVGEGPLRLGVDPTTDRVYVADNGSDTLTVVDGASTTLLGLLRLGHGPHELAVNATTGHVYVSNGADHTISVLDGLRLTRLATLSVVGAPGALAVNERLDRVYAVTDTGTVTVLDGATGRLLATVPAGQQPAGLAVDATTNRVYVTDPMDGTVWLLQDGRFGRPSARLIARADQISRSPGQGSSACGC